MRVDRNDTVESAVFETRVEFFGFLLVPFAIKRAAQAFVRARRWKTTSFFFFGPDQTGRHGDPTDEHWNSGVVCHPIPGDSSPCSDSGRGPTTYTTLANVTGRAYCFSRVGFVFADIGQRRRARPRDEKRSLPRVGSAWALGGPAGVRNDFAVIAVSSISPGGYSVDRHDTGGPVNATTADARNPRWTITRWGTTTHAHVSGR